MGIACLHPCVGLCPRACTFGSCVPDVSAPINHACLHPCFNVCPRVPDCLGHYACAPSQFRGPSVHVSLERAYLDKPPMDIVFLRACSQRPYLHVSMRAYCLRAFSFGACLHVPIDNVWLRAYTYGSCLPAPINHASTLTTCPCTHAPMRNYEKKVKRKKERKEERKKARGSYESKI